MYEILTVSRILWILLMNMRSKITILYVLNIIKIEINAYSVEIRLNPSVSEKYALERLYMLWKQETLYDYSLKHYKH